MPNSRPVCSTEASFCSPPLGQGGRWDAGRCYDKVTRTSEQWVKARILGPRSSAVTVGSSGQTVLKATLSRTQALPVGSKACGMPWPIPADPVMHLRSVCSLLILLLCLLAVFPFQAVLGDMAQRSTL